jgi:integrase
LAGTVRQAKIETRTARAKLSKGREPHWRTIIPGRAHIGYQRKEGMPQGRWLLRRYNGAAYSVEALGLADDAADADGEGVLSFEQAHMKAVKRAGAPASKPIGKLTVRKALALYFDHLRAMGKPTYDAEHRASVRISPQLGDIEVAQLTASQLRKWLFELASSPAFARTGKSKAQRFKKANSNDPEVIRQRRSTANRTLTILKGALNFCFDEGHVATNDAWGRKLKPFPSVDAPRVRYLTVDECRRLINASTPDFRLLVRAALATGARFGELAALKVSDFHFGSSTLHVRMSKSGKGRHVALSDEGVALFSGLTAGRPGDAPMLVKADGATWTVKNPARRMAEVCARAGITPPANFHALRHTYASLSIMNGAALFTVAKNLGHADVKMITQHYGHLSPAFVAESVRSFAPKFGVVEDDTNIVPLAGKAK